MEEQITATNMKDLEDRSKQSTGKILSYTSAWLIDTMIIAIYGVTVFYFYEVEIGLAVFYVAIAFGIFAFWNAINDPLIAFLTERPRSKDNIAKIGFRTPWIIFGAFSVAFLLFIIFLPPNVDAKSNPLPVFIYMVVTICLFDACYTILNSNLTAGAIAMFKTDDSRRKFGVFALIFSTMGVIVVNAIILPNFLEFGNKDSFVLASGITMIVLFINAIIIIPGIKEPDHVKEYYLVGRDETAKEKLSLLKTLRVALSKKNFIVYIIAYFLFVIEYNLFYASQLYFIKDVLGQGPDFLMFGWLAFIMGFLIAIPLWLKISKKIGNWKVYGYGYIFMGLTLLPFLWLITPLEFIIFAFMVGFCYSAPAIMLFPIISDTFDEVTASTGVHQDATLQGITNFFFRLSYLIVAAIIAIVHVATGYNQDPKASQTSLAIIGVRVHTGLIPAILLLIAGIMFLLIYDMYGKKKLKIQEILIQKNI
ncbi:MAG: MFS transporter [Candidatus Lokiarchaeota archaeon]|nr:MFS transporter [Candidatus Lokiarchaeota archaeon]MBD3339642.1 MFS transporter [Candidatus Lokiarchaeota archaeon]